MGKKKEKRKRVRETSQPQTGKRKERESAHTRSCASAHKSGTRIHTHTHSGLRWNIFSLGKKLRREKRQDRNCQRVSRLENDNNFVCGFLNRIVLFPWEEFIQTQDQSSHLILELLVLRSAAVCIWLLANQDDDS